MSKPSTPVKRSVSLVTGEPIPLTGSMEVLTPGLRVSGSIGILEKQDSKGRPRVPIGAAPPSSSRSSRSSRDGIRASSESIPLTCIMPKAELPVSISSRVSTPEATAALGYSEHPWAAPTPVQPSTEESLGGGPGQPQSVPPTPSNLPPPTPSTPGSVASGRIGGRGSDVFFTALRRSFGDDGASQYDDVEEEEEEEEEKEERDDDETVAYMDPYPEDLSSSTAMNPMQSPTGSFLSSAPDPAGLGAAQAYGRYAESASGSAEPSVAVSQSSLMSVINNVYMSLDFGRGSEADEDEAGASMKDRQVEELDADVDVLLGSRMSLSQLEELRSQQASRASELGQYVQDLETKVDDEGKRLIELPRNYAVMIERLMRERRAEYKTLQGWLGPTKYEDLPISRLPNEEADPVIAEGLANIRRLDEELAEKTVEALIVARETFPERHQGEQRARLDRHAARVEDALKRERGKRMRVSRLTRAVSSLAGPEALSTITEDDAEDSESQALRQSNLYHRFFQLQPEEEELVDRVLERDEDALTTNPFDLSHVMTVQVPATPRGASALRGQHPEPAPDLEPSTQNGVNGEETLADLESAVMTSLAEINERLEAFTLDHKWDDQGRLADFKDIRDGQGVTSTGAEEASVKSSGQKPLTIVVARPPSPPRSIVASSSVTATGKRDYLREEREAKELLAVEKDLDQRLRAFKIAELPPRLPADQIAALVAECRKLEASREAAATAATTPAASVAHFEEAPTPSSVSSKSSKAAAKRGSKANSVISVSESGPSSSHPTTRTSQPSSQKGVANGKGPSGSPTVNPKAGAHVPSSPMSSKSSSSTPKANTPPVQSVSGSQSANPKANTASAPSPAIDNPKASIPSVSSSPSVISNANTPSVPSPPLGKKSAISTQKVSAPILQDVDAVG